MAKTESSGFLSGPNSISVEVEAGSDACQKANRKPVITGCPGSRTDGPRKRIDKRHSQDFVGRRPTQAVRPVSQRSVCGTSKIVDQQDRYGMPAEVSR